MREHVVICPGNCTLGINLDDHGFCPYSDECHADPMVLGKREWDIPIEPGKCLWRRGETPSGKFKDFDTATLNRIVKQAISDGGKKRRQIALALDLPTEGLYRRLNGSTPWRYDELRTVARLLDCSLAEWTRMAEEQG